jgi:hypothetical protein
MLETLTLSILDPDASSDWLEQQSWETLYLPSLQSFPALHSLALDQTYLITTIGRYRDTHHDSKAIRTFLPPHLKTLTVNRCTDALAQSVPTLPEVLHVCDSLEVLNLQLAVPGRRKVRELNGALSSYFGVDIDMDGNPEGWKIIRKKREVE